MNIDKQRLKQIIKEEIEAVLKEEEVQKSFGRDSLGKTALASSFRDQAKKASTQSGIDNVERGIIDRITKDLEKLANVTNLKSGSTFAYLKKLVTSMEKEIRKLSPEEETKPSGPTTEI